MKFYKISNEVMAIEQGQEFLVKTDWVEMTVEEIELFKNPPKTQEQVIAEFTGKTTAYIEEKVQAYNQANGLAFKDIDAFTKYAVNPLSTHNAIANQFIAYADKVWSAVRTYQATATAIPTEAEFKAVLDGVVF